MKTYLILIVTLLFIFFMKSISKARVATQRNIKPNIIIENDVVSRSNFSN
jgi:hypothetical protein